MKSTLLFALNFILALSLLSALKVSLARAEQPIPINRRQMVMAAFAQMPEIYNYLANDQTFQKSLTAEEASQFTQLYRVISKNQQSQTFPYTYGFNESPKEKPIQLDFSDDQSLFKLNPDEPIRSARTTAVFSDTIYFNLSILNAIKSEIQYLDLFAILTHEFGHKIESEKNENLFNSVAVKIKDYLKNFYIEATLPSGFKVYAVSLPQSLKADGTFISTGPRVPMVVDKNGLTAYHFIDLLGIQRMNQNFLPESGNMDQLSSIRVTQFHLEDEVHDRALSFEMLVDFQIKTQVVYVNPNVSLKMSPYSNSEFMPQYTYVPLLKKENFVTGQSPIQTSVPGTWDLNHANPQSLPLDMGRHFRRQLFHPQDLTGQVKILAVNETATNISFTFEKPFGEKFVSIPFMSGEQKLELPASQIFEDAQKITFTVIKPKDKSFQVTQVVFPEKGFVLLDSPIKVKANAPLTELAGNPKITSVEAYATTKWGDTGWSEFKPDEPIYNFDQDELKFRVKVKLPKPILQLKLGWTVGTAIYTTKNSQSLGTYGSLVEEYIKNFKSTDLGNNEYLIEFSARPQFLKARLDTSQKEILTRDSGHRFLKSIIFTTTDWQSGGYTYRSENQPYTGEGLKLTPRLTNQTLDASALALAPSLNVKASASRAVNSRALKCEGLF